MITNLLKAKEWLDINKGGVCMLQINTEIREQEINFILVGELDMYSCDLLDDTITNAELSDIKRINFVITELDFIDSTGIGHLIKYYRQYNEDSINVEIINENPDIEEVLELIGLRQIMLRNSMEKQ